MKIDIELEGYEEGRAEEAIFTLIADRMVQSISDELSAKVGRMLDRKIDECAVSVLTPMIEKHLETPYQPVNTYGEPSGEPITLRSRIAKKLDECTQIRREDRQGFGNRPETAAESFLRTQIVKELHKEFASIVNSEKQKIATALRNNAAEALIDAVKRIK